MWMWIPPAARGMSRHVLATARGDARHAWTSRSSPSRNRASCGRPGTREPAGCRAARWARTSWAGSIPARIDRDPVGHLDIVFGLAEKHGKPVDIHLHEPGEMGAFSHGADHRAHARAGHAGRRWWSATPSAWATWPSANATPLLAQLAEAGRRARHHRAGLAPGAAGRGVPRGGRRRSSPAMTASATPGAPMARRTCCERAMLIGLQQQLAPRRRGGAGLRRVSGLGRGAAASPTTAWPSARAPTWCWSRRAAWPKPWSRSRRAASSSRRPDRRARRHAGLRARRRADLREERPCRR